MPSGPGKEQGGCHGVTSSNYLIPQDEPAPGRRLRRTVGPKSGRESDKTGTALGGPMEPRREEPGYDWPTVTTRPIEARTLPTRTHSVSGPTFTTALPVLCTCQAISQPFSSVHAIAFMSWRTTCSNVWQSQLCRMVIHGGAAADWTSSTSST